MKLPLSWLKDYVEVKESPQKLADSLLLTGTKVDSIETIDEDSVFEFEVTPNRADCLSAIGIAREIAAIYKRQLIIPAAFSETPKPQSQGKEVVFQVADRKLCPAYSIGVIDSVKVGPSPDWLAHRLEKSGIRSINNIVDITNYVMLETGQPMHAFDFTKITGRMNLRAAGAGEKIITLDGIERSMPQGAVVIEDAEKLIDLAGLMGGESSEIDQNTTTVVLHVPIYDPLAIRRTSQVLGLRTEASNRFEKQLDPSGHRYGFERAAFLLSTIAQGSLASEIKSVGYGRLEREIKLPASSIGETLGIQLSEGQIKEILASLEFATSLQGRQLKVIVPSFRTDVRKPIDIIEEIGRIYGYNKFPRTLPAGEIPSKDLPSEDFEREIRGFFGLLGLQEIYSSSLTSGEIIESAGYASEDCLRVANRLVVDYEFLRPTLMVGLLAAAKTNQENFNQFSLFELGKVFEKKEAADKLPSQPNKIAALFFNSNFAKSRGALEAVFRKLNIAGAKFTLSEESTLFTQPAANIYLGDVFLGKIGKIKPETSAKFDINLPAFGFELDCETLRSHSAPTYYQPIPKFPTVKENISLFLPEEVAFADVAGAVEKAAGKNYYSLQLLEDTQIERRRSILIGVEYYDPSHTLNKEKTGFIRGKILKELRAIGAQPRIAPEP